MNTLPVEIVDEPKIGTATWMIPPKANEVFPFSEGAVWLGRNGDDARTPMGRKDESHVLLCAMNRAAKGRAIITNNLLLWQGSMFCNDPKGENASVTAARRGQGSKHTTKFLGQKVCVLDSHHTAKVEDRYRAYYNVLEDLDPTSSRTPARVENIVRSFFTDSAQKDPTWDELAVAYMKALLLHIVTAPASQSENDGYIPTNERDLITFRRMLQTGDYYAVRHIESVLPPEELAKKRPNAHQLLLKQMAKNDAFGGIIRDEAENQLSNFKDQPKLWNSLRVSAGSATAWVDDPEIRDVLRAGKYTATFRAEELETDPKGVSVYVCLKLEDQKRLAAWPRLVTNMVLSAAQKDYFRSPATGHNTLMMLDEFAALERMKTIEQAAPAIAGAGIKLFMVLQNLSQMKSVYGENFEAFMANAGTHIYYGFNDNFTAEYVKKRLGEIEIIRHSRSGSKATGSGKSTSTSTGGGSQDGTSEGVSAGKTRGWSPSLFHLSLFTSKQKNRNTQSGTSSSTNENWSRAVQEQQNQTNTDGWTQQLHKKPLADIHELMQLFGAVDDPDALNFPGIGLISTAEKAPALVQKSFYDQDQHFEGMFDPHPKHGFKALPEPVMTILDEPEEDVSKIPEMRSRLNGVSLRIKTSCLKSPIKCFAASKDSNLLAASSEKDGIVIWHAEDGEEQHRLSIDADDIEFSPRGDYFAVLKKNKILIFSLPNFQKINEIVCREDFGNYISISKCGYRIAISTGHPHFNIRNCAYVYDTTTQVELFDFAHPWSVQKTRFAPDGTYLVTSSPGDTSRVWSTSDITSASLITKLAFVAKNWAKAEEPLQTLADNDGRAYSVDVSPESIQIATGQFPSLGGKADVVVWEAKTGKVIHRFSGHKNRVDDVKFSQSGKLLASCSKDKSIRIWNLFRGELAATIFDDDFSVQIAHEGALRFLDFSPDEKRLFVTSHDQSIMIFNVPNNL